MRENIESNEKTDSPNRVSPRVKKSCNEDFGSTSTIAMPAMAHLSSQEVSNKKTEPRILKISCHHCGQRLDVTKLPSFSKINCPICNHQLIVPKWFDSYLLEELHGRGGMAMVYRGLDITLDREVAIKVLDQQIADDSQLTDLFLHEARTVATINHYAVIPIYTCGIFENQPYMVMQFMHGGSLEDQIFERKDFVSIKEAACWLRDIAEGLEKAWRHDIVHHDIKPGNIMLDSDGNAKIGDFGIANSVSDSHQPSILEVTKSWLSPHYVSPEKATTKEEDFRGDIYSLGATFYHVLTKHYPYDHEDTNTLLMMRTIQPPPDPISYRADLPPLFTQLILSMMHLNPAKRPSYRDIINTVQPYTEETPSPDDVDVLIPETLETSEKALNSKTPSPPLDEKKELLEKKRVVSQHLKIIVKLSIISLLLVGCFIGGLLIYQKIQQQQIKAPEEVSSLSLVTSRMRNGKPLAAADNLKILLKKGDFTDQERAQLCVLNALVMYLNNEVNVTQKVKLGSTFVFDNFHRSDPYFQILEFLSAREPQEKTLDLKLFDQCPTAVRLAHFVRALYDKKDLKSVVSYLDELASVFPDSKAWDNCCTGRIKNWRQALEKGQSGIKDLERLLSVYLNSTKIQSSLSNTVKQENLVFFPKPITVDYLSSLSTRKRPNFEATYQIPENSANYYLGHLDGAEKEREKNRIVILNGIKKQLISDLNHMSWNGTSVLLKSGENISYVNSLRVDVQNISIPVEDSRRRICKWEQISPQQIIQWLRFYAEIRKNIDKNDARMKKELQYSLLRIAIMHEWMGQYSEAATVYNEIVDLCPGYLSEVNKYLKK